MIIHDNRAASLRFGRLRVKLFLAIAGVNALLAIAMYLIFSSSFDQGVADYLKRSDADRLDQLIVSLGEGYAREGNWNWITKNEARWGEMTRSALGLPPRRAEEDPASRAMVREYPLTINRRLILFDDQRRRLIGRAELAQLAQLKPILADGATVGYLGYVPRVEQFDALTRLYTQQQTFRFGALALGMLAASLLLGAGLAHWLSVRIRDIGRGTTALIQGEYGIALDAHGRDELAQLARDFNKLAATLRANRDARNEWIADIAHELRTPLAVLRGEIEALQDGVRPLDRAGLGSLAQEVGRLARIVEDLHLLSTSDLGALSHHFEPQDLRELIEETVEHHSSALQAKEFQLNLKLGHDAIVQGDETRLVQVFNNLLQNTLRYTDAPGQLHIDLHREGENWVVDWQDSNPGVPEGDLPRLTDRLFRVESSRNRASGGSGLGLAIVKAIMGAHHGRMESRHSPLGGLWWRLEFPAYGPSRG
jgi:two-component system, OmpR family, sensor histidine kinase BaeS